MIRSLDQAGSTGRTRAIDRGGGRILEATHPDRIGSTVDSATLELRADEGLVVELDLG